VNSENKLPLLEMFRQLINQLLALWVGEVYGVSLIKMSLINGTPRNIYQNLKISIQFLTQIIEIEWQYIKL
jgi:hypothetical protein